ncbi:HET-domain-containing protein [Stipitochalara longipes BDJ]|nr:HET-domain-containing protein [Stipitochalara longipes BDJ]
MCRLLAGSFKAGGFEGPQNRPHLCYLTSNNLDGDGIKVCLITVGSEQEPGEKGGWQIIRKTIEYSATQNELSFASANSNSTFGSYYGRRMESCQVNFDLIRQWIQSCETTHGDICKLPSLDLLTACRIRLIDVLNRRLVDGTTSERYIALSYVWGTGNQFCLSKENQGDLRSLHGIEDQELPNTISDAFQVVAEIGERYLRIGRLCILMDDETDKMDQIYSAAVLTLVSASACCANADIAGVKPNTRQLIQHSEIIRGVDYITTQPDLASVLRHLNWSTRGWTYQEGFLSSRCLVFTSSQVYLQCKSEVVCEDCSWIGRKQSPIPKVGNALCQIRYHPLQFSPCAFYQYADAVEAFSIRELTVETDVLWAFSGVTKAFGPHFPQGFIWGLPIDALDAALLWKWSRSLDGIRNGLHSAIVDYQTIRLPFPSWSWTSWDGAVEYAAKCEEESKGLVEWQPAARSAVDVTKPLSSVRGSSSSIVACMNDHDLLRPGEVIINERELGFLRFTTESVNLEIELKKPGFNESRPDYDSSVEEERSHEYETYSEDNMSSRKLVQGLINSAVGTNIGFVWVEESWFKGRSTRYCELILLSACVQDEESENCQPILQKDPDLPGELLVVGIKHLEGCEHQSQYYVMLIEWKEGPYCLVASRVGADIPHIHRDDWAAAGPTCKEIVLG